MVASDWTPFFASWGAIKLAEGALRDPGFVVSTASRWGGIGTVALGHVLLPIRWLKKGNSHRNSSAGLLSLSRFAESGLL